MKVKRPSFSHLAAPSALCAYPPDTPMLLAFSGGADSCLLLHLAATQAKKAGAVLRLAHVHHGIRGEEADRDEQFCRRVAADYGLPIDVLHADVPTLAKERGASLETVARQVRYDYFESLMKEHGIPLLLTAHHADDNLETVLFHLIRGTGLAGLCGIPPTRPLRAEGLCISGREATVVRPLLSLCKADILAACGELGLAYVTDSTNAETLYARNRLRAEVVPVLEELVDHPQAQLLRTCSLLREDEALLCRLAEQLLMDSRQGDALIRARLADAPPPIAKRTLRAWIGQQAGFVPDACHVKALLSLCQDGGTSHSHYIKEGCVAVADKQHLRLCPTPDVAHPHSYRYPWQSGRTECPRGGFRVYCDFQKQPKNKDTINVYKPFTRDTLTFDTIIPCGALDTSRLYWRQRQDGDTVLQRGLHRKLRKLQNEQGIPPALRERLPVLCDDDGIVWAPLIGLRDGLHSPTGETWHVRIELWEHHIKDE